MSYAVPVLSGEPRRRVGRARRADRLGDVSSTAQSVQTSAQAAQSAAMAARSAGSLLSTIENLFDPGAARDAARLARANFFRDAAKVGSVTAARYILGGLANVASNEHPYYTAAQSAVLASPSPGPEAMQEAAAQGPKWNTNDVAGDPTKHAMIDDVQRDLQSLAQYVGAPTTTTTTTSSGTSLATAGTTGGGGGVVHTLPGMTTTAAFNWAPYAISGGLALAAILFSRKR